MIALPAQQMDGQAVDVHPTNEIETLKSLVARQTRSRRPDLTPITLNTELDVGKNYIHNNV